MKKKHYIQPKIVCNQISDGQELMTGSSTIETEVYDDNFDPANMESLSRKHSIWDDEDDNTEKLF